MFVDTHAHLDPTSSVRLRSGLREAHMRNEPKNVKMVAQFIAKLRNLPVDEVASITSANARRLFKIDRE